MAFAETAKLSIDLNLTGNFQAGLAKAQRSLAGLSSSSGPVGRLQRSFGGLRKSMLASVAGGVLAANSIESAFSGLEHILSTTITKATEWGETVSKVKSITNGTAQATSALVDTLDYFGVGVESQLKLIAMAQKNVGVLAASGKASAFTATFGLSLKNTKISAKQLGDALAVLGDKAATAADHKHAAALIKAFDKAPLKDFNALILESADYFNNKSIPAQTKAAALAKIFGRNWQALIPVFQQGSAKLRAMEGDAIKLSDEDLKNMDAFKEASREWNDALGDLQIMIGAKLLPQLTGLAKTASEFVRGHSADIVQFFKDAGEAAGHLASDALDVAKAIQGVWNGIPPELRDILVKGLIADRTVKFLFGFSPIKFAANALSGLVGTVFQKGFVQPVFVTNQVPGGGGGLGLGGIKGLLLGGGIVAAVVAEVIALQDARAKTQPIIDQGKAAGLTPGEITAQIAKNSPSDAATIFKHMGMGLDQASKDLQSGSNKLIHGADGLESARGALMDALHPKKPAMQHTPGDTQAGMEGQRGNMGDRLFSQELAKIAKSTDVQTVGGDIETMRGSLAAGLVDTQTAATNAGGEVSRNVNNSAATIQASQYGAASGIIAAIYAAQPVITITNNVSATTVNNTVKKVKHYGPTGGDRQGPSGMSHTPGL